MNALDSKTLSYEEKEVFTPKLEDIREGEISNLINQLDKSYFIAVIKNGLKLNFAHVEVEVVDCPDLTEAPYHLASKGFIYFSFLAKLC